MINKVHHFKTQKGEKVVTKVYFVKKREEYKMEIDDYAHKVIMDEVDEEDRIRGEESIQFTCEDIIKIMGEINEDHADFGLKSKEDAFETAERLGIEIYGVYSVRQFAEDVEKLLFELDEANENKDE